jgi:nucleotide-binding universal stress UspA family protein
MGTTPRTGPVAVEFDGTVEGLRVIDYACEEARHSGADLLLVRAYRNTVTYAPMLPQYLPDDPAELAKTDLHDAVSRVRSQAGFEIQVRTMSFGGMRHQALGKAADGARMLLVGRRRARGPHRTVAAQSDLNLAGAIDCPLVVVPTGWKRGLADRTVYVGIDGSALSREAIGFAYATAAQRRGHLVVVHAEKGARRRIERDGETTWATPLELTMAESLAGFAERYPEVKVTRFITNQPVTDALIGASQHAGLLVLGAHAGRLPHDPTTRRALANAACPVAVVKHQAAPGERQREHTVGTDVVVPTY